MGSLCGLALPLLLLCWETGVSGDLPEPSPDGPCPRVTTNSIEGLTVTPEISTSLEGAFPTTGLAKTTVPARLPVRTPTLGTESFSKTLILAAATSKTETKEMLTISPASQSRDTQTPSLAPKIRDTQTLFSVTETRDTLTPFPVMETRDTPTSFPVMETRDVPIPFPVTEAGDTPTPFPVMETRDTPTPFPVTETRDTQTTFPITETRDTQTTFPVMETRDTQTTSPVTKTRPDSDPMKTVFDTLCTDGSSEETRCITNDVLTLVITSAEAENLSPDSGSSSDSFVPIISTSQALGPGVANPLKALVACSTTHIKFPRETETAAAISGTSDTGHSATEVKALSTSETSALSTYTEAKLPVAGPTAPAEALSTASASESANPNTALEASLPSSATETEATPVPGGTWVTGSMGPLALSGAITVSPVAASTAGKVTSSAGSSASVSSSSQGAAINKSTPSETFTTGGTISRAFPISRGLLPSVYPTTANSNLETNLTSAMTTTSAETPSETFTTDSAFPTSSPLYLVHLTTVSSGQEINVTSAMALASPKIPSETFTTEGTTSRAFSTSRSVLPSDLATIAASSQETSITSAKTVTSPKTPSETFTTERDFPTSSPLYSVHRTIASNSQGTNITSDVTVVSSKTPRKPPTTTSSTVSTRQTPEVTAGEDGGFLLVRLRVASTEDLTEPTKAQRLVQQLQCELQAHLPPVQFSLLHVQRS